jgi:Multicopper oxidase
MLNQAATPAERTNAGGGGQGPNETQLLATVIVSGGKPVTGDLGAFVRNVLYEGNKNDPTLPKAALEGLPHGDLTPWRGMPEAGPASNTATPRSAAFFIGNLPDPKDATKSDFGFWLNKQMYDPDRVDMTLQVGATEDWVLTSSGEPHIFHIHVNPFEVIDVTQGGKSIFGPHGECLVPPDSVGLQNQYCNMWHTFKDTVFVQNDYEVHVRSTYDRYIGEFVMHCHILDHEDSGMMANVLIVPDVAAPGGGLGMPGMMSMSNGTMTHDVHRQWHRNHARRSLRTGASRLRLYCGVQFRRGWPPRVLSSLSCRVAHGRIFAHSPGSGHCQTPRDSGGRDRRWARPCGCIRAGR